jgi:hypothetical protein
MKALVLHKKAWVVRRMGEGVVAEQREVNKKERSQLERTEIHNRQSLVLVRKQV